MRNIKMFLKSFFSINLLFIQFSHAASTLPGDLSFTEKKKVAQSVESAFAEAKGSVDKIVEKASQYENDAYKKRT